MTRALRRVGLCVHGRGMGVGGGILDIAYFVVYVSVCNEYLIHMSQSLQKHDIKGKVIQCSYQANP